MKAKEGEIYQINPESDNPLGGCLVVVTEPETWGIQGYVFLDRPEHNILVRYEGRAFVRVNWDQIVKVGYIEWIATSHPET